MLSLQNILSRQIAADIEEKFANQEEVLHGGISLYITFLSSKWKPCHGATNSQPHIILE